MKSKLSLVLLAPILFLAGLVMGLQKSQETKEDAQILGLNHVGLRVSDFDKAMDFYQDDLGFPMTYRFNDENGQPIFAYFQINKSTFIELLPANEERPEGIDHFGLETNKLESLVSHFHDLGIKTTESSVSPFTHVNLAHASDVNGIYFELIEATEGSDLRRVMDNWNE